MPCWRLEQSLLSLRQEGTHQARLFRQSFGLTFGGASPLPRLSPSSQRPVAVPLPAPNSASPPFPVPIPVPVAVPQLLQSFKVAFGLQIPLQVFLSALLPPLIDF